MSHDCTRTKPSTQPETARTSDAVPRAVPHACPSCGAIDVPTVTPGTGPHAYRANCSHCGKFLKWLSKYSPAERIAHRQHALRHAMAQRPPTVAQLAYLKALGDPEPVPGTIAEASARIDALRRGEEA